MGAWVRKMLNRVRPLLLGVCLLAGVLLVNLGYCGWRHSRRVAQAESAARAGRWEQVESALADAAKYGRLETDALRLRALAALRRDAPEAAAELLAQVPISDPRAAEARVTRGRLLLDLCRLRAADEALAEAVRLDPHAADAFRMRLMIAGVLKDPRTFEGAAWGLYASGADGAELEALRLLAPGVPILPPGAILPTADEGVVFRRALEADPDDAEVRAALAGFERRRGQVETARTLIESRIGRRSPEVPILLEAAALALDEGEIETAGRLLEPMPEGAETLSSYWILRAAWAEAVGRTEDAVTALRRARSLDPRNPEPHHRLGRLTGDASESSQAQSVQALTFAAARVVADPRDVESMNEAATHCRALERTREAEAWDALARKATRS